MTGVRYRSDRLKASTVSAYTSATDAGASTMIGWSPCVPQRACMTSPWAGPRAHHVDDDTGNLGEGRVADMLLHEREAGPAGGGHDLAPRQRGAEDRAHRGDLVLHLEEDAAPRRRRGGPGLGAFRGGRDGVARA